jgi:hypothetical protein
MFYYDIGNRFEISVSLEGLTVFMAPKFLIPTLFSYKVSDPLIAGLIEAESSFVLHSISPSNALGLYQMKPFFAKKIGVINPFFLWNEKKVSTYLERLTNDYGSQLYALTAYHLGEAGFLSRKKNEGNDSSLYSYAEKIASFQRQYSVGQKVRIKDYLKTGAQLSTTATGKNEGFLMLIVPTAWLGTTGFTLSISEEARFGIFQEIMLSSDWQMYFGYDRSPSVGFVFRSETWNESLALRFDFSDRALSWEGRFQKKPWTFVITGGIHNVSISCGYYITNQLLAAFGIKYEEAWIPSFQVCGVF